MEASIESTLFDKLKEIREEKKISLEDIARNTRINIQFLEALEKGDLLQIPRVYDKLFFKSYLKALGLNDTEYYDDFLAFRDQLRQEKTTIMTQDLSEEQSKEGIRINYKYLSLMILPVVIAICVIWFLVANTKSVVSNNADQIEAIDIRKIVAETQPKPDSSVAQSVNAPRAMQSVENLTLRITADIQTWFRVVVDLQDTLEYTLPAGNTMNLKAQNSFQFLIGKADGLQLNLNRKDLGKLGNTGEVVQYLLIDSTGIVTQKNVFPKNWGGKPDGN